MLNRTIRKITLKNVGPFKEEQTIEFAPFTLIFGKNSAGKSYLLNVIKQLANPFRTAEEFAEANIKGFDRHFSKYNPINIKWEIPVYSKYENDNSENDSKKVYFELNFSGDQQYLEISTSDYKKTDRFILKINLIDSVISFFNRDQNKIKSVQDTELISDFKIAIKNNLIIYDSDKIRTEMNKKKQKVFEITDKELFFLKSKEKKIKGVELRKIIRKFVKIVNNSISMVDEQFDYIPAHRLTPSKQNTKKEFLKIYNRLWGEIQTGEENYNISDSIVGIEQHYSLKEDITENLAPKKEETSKSPLDVTQDNPQKEETIENLAPEKDETSKVILDGSQHYSQKEETTEKDETSKVILDGSQNTHYWSADDILKWESSLNTDWKAVFLFLLNRLGYGNYDFLVDYLKIEGMDELFKISIKKDGQGTKQTLDEIGYGISQIFPVITAIALSKDRLIVEEPEIHLHPSAQLNFIRALVELDKEGIRPFHYIFETHSQIIIEFLLAQVEKNAITKNNISIIFIEQLDDVSLVENLMIYDDGSTSAWPGGFFTQIYEIEGI